MENQQARDREAPERWRDALMKVRKRLPDQPDVLAASAYLTLARCMKENGGPTPRDVREHLERQGRAR